MSEVELWQAVAMEEGDGARVRRLFPIPGHRNADPFVLCDELPIGVTPAEVEARTPAHQGRPSTGGVAHDGNPFCIDQVGKLPIRGR